MKSAEETIVMKNSERETLSQPKQKSSSSSIIVCFVLRRFLKKIQQRRESMLKLTQKHLQLIGDQGSDEAITLKHINFLQQNGMSIQKFTNLFNISIKHSHYKQLKDRIEKHIEVFGRFIHQWIQLIPLFHPESNCKIVWDYFAVFFRIIMLTLVPLDIGYSTSFMDQSLITLFMIFIIMLDFTVRINTVCYIKGVAIKDRIQIFYHQIQQTFLIDFSTILFLSSYLLGLPIEILIGVFLQYKYVNSFYQMSDQTSYLTKSQKGIISLVKLISSLIYILHLFSCVWYWVSSHSNISTSWMNQKGLQDQIWEIQYLESFYFAIVTMLTIGYGDNVPKTSQEKVLTIFFILGACLWFSYSINFIGSIIDDITENQRERNRRMRVINKYFSKRAIPYSLQYQIKEYLTYRWKEEDEIDLQLEQNLIESLSDELKESLEKQAHQLFVKKSDFLKDNFTDEFRKSLFKLIKRRIIEPQNFFNIQFEDSHNLCYVEQGEVLYQHKDPKQRSKINSVIKQGQFICVQDFLIENQEVNQFKAIGYVSLLTLSKKDFLNKLKDFQSDYQQYCNIKDQILLSNVIIKDGVFCPVCQKQDHNFNQCHQVQYIPDREAIIKRFQFSNQQNRAKFFRKRNKYSVNSLREKDLIEEFIILFQNDNPQQIQKQSQYQVISEQDNELNSSPNTLDDIPEVSQSYGLTQLKKNPQLRQILKAEECDSDRVITNNRASRRNSLSPMKIIKRNNLVQIQSLEYTDKKLDFQNQINENITIIFNKTSFLSEEERQDKFICQLENLHLKIKNQPMQMFDQIKSYEKYNISSNIKNVLFESKLWNNQWELSIIRRFINYTFYPFNYIRDNLKHMRMQVLRANTKPNQKFLKVKNKLKMLQLRNSLEQKKKSSLVRNIRSTQITPQRTPQSEKLIQMAL
ncbi:hypothetical protein pb186bvf_015957 [Paramecium bursaria]